MHTRPVTLLRTMLALFFFSGATSLVYQVVWLRQLVVVFGSTLHATSAVLSVFMGGLALGAYLGGRWIESRRVRSLTAYGVFEIGIGLYAFLIPTLLDAGSGFYAAAWRAGADSSPTLLGLVKLGGIALVLLPPTTLMGATLPILARRAADDPERLGGQVGVLYAVNTFGAVVGTFLAGFVALPQLGIAATTAACASANVALGTVALLVGRGDAPVEPTPAARAPAASSIDLRSAVVLAVFAASGFAAMVLEVAWTRGLSLVFGSSVYAFALMLVAFLVGLAAGAAAVSAVLKGRRPPEAGSVLAVCLAGAGLASFVTTYVLQALPGVFATIFFATSLSPRGLFFVQLALGLALMFPATFALGGVFPAVLQTHARELDRVATSVGRAYASNTAGTILGAAAAGFVFVPALGLVDTLTMTSAVQIALAIAIVVFVARASAARRLAAGGLLAACLAALPLLKPGWDFLMMNAGVYFNLQNAPAGTAWTRYLDKLRSDTRIVLAEEGLTASVLVADHLPSGTRYLAVNGKVEASSRADLETQLMAGHLPLLFHDAPRDVLIVGLASGISVSAVAAHAEISTIRVVEVERAMVRAARLFDAWNDRVLDDPRLSISINDARNDLLYAPHTYDVIVSEPSNPWMTVASNLFTRDFFTMAKRRLRPGGVFCQWVQLYCLEPGDMRSVIAAFRSAFPHVLVFGTMNGVDLLLLGTDDPLEVDLDRLGRGMSDLSVGMSLGRVDVRRPVDLLALFRVGSHEIDRLVDDARMNTDDNGRVEFSAPKSLFRETLGANAEVLLEARSDPVAYVRPRPATPAEDARLRLEIARRRLERDEREWAEHILEPLRNGPFGKEAEELLENRSAP